MNGIQKVVGSIPIVSTRLSLDAIRVPDSFFIEMSGSRFNQSKWTTLPKTKNQSAENADWFFYFAGKFPRSPLAAAKAAALYLLLL